MSICTKLQSCKFYSFFKRLLFGNQRVNLEKIKITKIILCKISLSIIYKKKFKLIIEEAEADDARAEMTF